MTEERDWRAFGYAIVERINAAPTVEKLEHLLILHQENLAGYARWWPAKHQALMELVAEKRTELLKEEKGARP